MLVNKAQKAGEALVSARLSNAVDECRGEWERLKPFRFGYRITILTGLLFLSLSCFSQQWLLSTDFSMGAESRFFINLNLEDESNTGRSNYFQVSVQRQVSDRIYLGITTGLSQVATRRGESKTLASGIIRKGYYVFRERTLDLGLEGSLLLWQGNTTGYLRIRGFVSAELNRVMIGREWNVGTSYSTKSKSKRFAEWSDFYFTGQIGLGNRWPLPGPWALGLEANTWYRTLENPADFFAKSNLARHGWRIGGQVSIFYLI